MRLTERGVWFGLWFRGIKVYQGREAWLQVEGKMLRAET